MSSLSPRVDLAELERRELETVLDARGQQRFRAAQIFLWIHARGVGDPAAMSDLPRELRDTLASEFTLTTPTLIHRDVSADGTQKFLLRLADGRTIDLSTGSFTKQAQSTKKKDAAKVGIGAGVGAAIGAIAGGGKGAAIGTVVGGGAGAAEAMATRGDPATIPGETRLTFKLTAPVKITKQ